MDEETNIDTETIEEQAEIIENDQRMNDQNIVELDEAAGSAEGLTNREDDLLNLNQEVPEDRDATPPKALDDIGEIIS